MMEARLFALQRLTAMLMGPFVIVHLLVILYAVRGGLSAEEILARTTSSVIWPLFYMLFVVAAAVHGPIGIRNVLREWSPLPSHVGNWIAALFAAVLLVLGLRAVWAISGWAV